MKKKCLQLTLVILAAFLPGVAFAQTLEGDSLHYDNIRYNAPNDSTHLVAKNFDQDKVSELKADSDLNYKQPPTIAESVWQRFLLWLSQIFGKIVEGATSTNWGRVLVYAAAIAGFIAVILLILKVDAFKILYTGADSGAVTTIGFHENIHEMNFEKLIHDAIADQKYREGIRLVFLYSLKLLTDKHYIEWQPGKTNHDYVNELSKGDLKIKLNELSFYFDYAWYGNFTVQEGTFRKTEALLNSLKQKVSE